MFNKINENRVQNDNTNGEQNTNDNHYQLNAKEPENQKKYSEPQNIVEANLINQIGAENNNRDAIENMNQNEKNPIFKVIYRTLHSGDDPDNIKQMVIRDFINFFVKFINFIINEKIKIEGKKECLTENTQTEIEFKIGYQLKPIIKFEDINELNVEQLLSFDSYKNIKTENNEKAKIIKIKTKFGSALDKLFETKVIELFKDIYYKQVKNESDKDIDLKKYGIEGIIFKITAKIPTFQKLKDKYKDNLYKINKMNEIVESNIIRPKLFNVKKKSTKK